MPLIRMKLESLITKPKDLSRSLGLEEPLIFTCPFQLTISLEDAELVDQLKVSEEE